MRSDWNILGNGLVTIINDGVSYRCQISNNTTMLWNGNQQLTNCEIISDVKMIDFVANRSNGGLILRSDAGSVLSNCYWLFITSPNKYTLYRTVSAQATLLATYNSLIDYNVFRTIRFRIDGFTISVDEYINGSWVNRILVVDNVQTLTAGRAGVCGWSGSASYNILFDNININQR